MKRFTKDERMMMMLYNPGTREGLIAELEAMRLQLTPTERRLKRLSKSVLEKLDGMTDAEFDGLDLYPDI
jgi:hypothetical protein